MPVIVVGAGNVGALADEAEIMVSGFDGDACVTLYWNVKFRGAGTLFGCLIALLRDSDEQSPWARRCATAIAGKEVP